MTLGGEPLGEERLLIKVWKVTVVMYIGQYSFNFSTIPKTEMALMLEQGKCNRVCPYICVYKRKLSELGI